MKIINIKKNDIGLRIDNFLCKSFPHLKKSFIFKALRTKKIKLNNKKITYSYHLQEHDKIFIYLEKEMLVSKKDELWKLAKNDLDVVYEDSNLLIVNKPTKLIVCDQANILSDTLINRAKLYLYQTNKWNPFDENQFAPCLIHRIDMNTSGLVMIAKNHSTAVILTQKIKNKEIDKYYQCLVYGKMKHQANTLKAFLFKEKEKNFVKISYQKLNQNFVPILTSYKVLNYDKIKKISLLEIKLITGKTHQIRAHLNFINHPIVGEQKYTNKQISKIQKYKNQCLVAHKIVFNFNNVSTQLDYLKGKIIKLNKINFI